MRAFEQLTLPRERWTHAAHLVVGLWYVLHLGRERAFEAACVGIERYNRAAGRTPEERGGFDAGVTRTWMDPFADYAGERGPGDLDGALLRELVAAFG